MYHETVTPGRLHIGCPSHAPQHLADDVRRRLRPHELVHRGLVSPEIETAVIAVGLAIQPDLGDKRFLLGEVLGARAISSSMTT